MSRYRFDYDYGKLIVEMSSFYWIESTPLISLLKVIKQEATKQIYALQLAVYSSVAVVVFESDGTTEIDIDTKMEEINRETHPKMKDIALLMIWKLFLRPFQLTTLSASFRVLTEV
jgi:hypothetical protein